MPYDFACPDWAEKLAASETPIADLPLDRKAADRAVAVFDRLRLPDVPGKPTLAEAVGEWFRDIVRAAFGSVRRLPAGGIERQVGEVFVLVPKKNGKTTNSAALAITFMLLNERPKADMLIIGPTQKISDVAFQQAAGMIAADSWLSDRFHVRDDRKEIKDRVNGSRLMVRTFGMDVLTGAKPIFCLIDEIHVLGGTPYAADVIRQIRGGMFPFPDALMVMITTQSDHPPQGVFRSELQYARGVRDGRITEGVRQLPVLYEFPEALQTSRGKDWMNPDLWHMVTPQMGRQLTVERMLSGLQRAQEDGEGEVRGWATQHLNVEVGMALHANRWRGADYWEAAADEGLDLESLLTRSEVAVIGIDGGGLDDLMGLAIVGRCRESKRWLGWAHAWAHPSVLEQRKEIAGILRGFADEGDLTICSDPTEDVRGVADIVQMVHAQGLLPEAYGIGYDPFGVAALIDEIAGRGVPEETMVAVPQGSRLSPAVWGLERKLNDRTFRHGGQRLMAWCIGNAVAEQRGNAVIITKETAGKAKIDPLIATFNAVMLMTRNPDPQGSSYLENDGLLVL